MRIDLCVVIGTMCNLISESVDNVEREREREKKRIYELLLTNDE